MIFNSLSLEIYEKKFSLHILVQTYALMFWVKTESTFNLLLYDFIALLISSQKFVTKFPYIFT